MKGFQHKRNRSPPDATEPLLWFWTGVGSAVMASLVV